MARKKKAKGNSSPGTNRGDLLARGAASASFGSMSHIDQAKWDSIFGPTKPVKRYTKTF